MSHFRATTVDEILIAKLGIALDLKDYSFQGMREISNQFFELISRIADIALECDDGEISSYEVLQLIRPVVADAQARMSRLREHSESMRPHFEKIDRLLKEAVERGKGL